MAKYNEILMENLKYIEYNLKSIKKYIQQNMIFKIMMPSKLM